MAMTGVLMYSDPQYDLAIVYRTSVSTIPGFSASILFRLSAYVTPISAKLHP